MAWHVVTACGCVRMPECLLLVGKDAWCDTHEVWSPVVRKAKLHEITGRTPRPEPGGLPF
jgi:hypothetical protein